MTRKKKTEPVGQPSAVAAQAQQTAEVPVVAPVAQQAVVAPKPMSNIERVKLMNALAESTEDVRLISAFNTLSKGDQIFEIFKEAVDKEIAKLMGEADEPIQVATLAEVGHALKGAAMGLADFRNAIIALSQSPIMGILNTLHRNTGGSNAIHNRPLPPMEQNGSRAPSILHPDAIGNEADEQWITMNNPVIY
jgi:hypothetical protein